MMANFVNPSREDAWDMTRHEKMSLTFLMNATSALIDAKTDLGKRVEKLGMTEKLKEIADGTVDLLESIRTTIPEKQRTSLMHTSMDYEMRLVPKMTPSKTCVVLMKEEMRTLVDAAQAACLECTGTFEDSEKCNLCQLLKTILPMDSYEGTFLCPYNGREWGN